MGRDSAVGLATCYRLGGPGAESRWGRDFPKPSTQALGPTQPPVHWGLDFFPGDKAAEGVALTIYPHIEARLKITATRLFCSGHSWLFLGRTLPLSLNVKHIFCGCRGSMGRSGYVATAVLPTIICGCRSPVDTLHVTVVIVIIYFNRRI